MSYNRRDDDQLDRPDDSEDTDEDDESIDRAQIRSNISPFTGSSGYSRPSSGERPGSGERSGAPANRYGSSSRLPGQPGSADRPGAPANRYGSSSRLPGQPGPAADRPGASSPRPGGPPGGGYASRTGGSPSYGGSSYGQRPSPTREEPPRPDDASKEDDKPAKPKGDGGPGAAARNALGGIGSRLPGGGARKEDKPAAPKGDSGGSGPRAALGGITSRLPGSGAKKEDKPAAPKGDSGGSGPRAALGGIASRLPGGGSKPADKPAAPKPQPGAGDRQGPLSSRFRPGGGAAASSAPAAKPAPAPSGGSKPGLADRMKGIFSKGDRPKKATSVREKAARASKAPRVEGEGLTLDNKLDILGVVLLLGALALFFSSLSPTQGQLTGAINEGLGQLLGIGALAVPGLMFAIGLWLIVRHFGDEAPTIDPVRISGVAVLYVGLLLVAQFIESFSPEYATINPADTAQLQLLLDLTWQRGLGGGWVGAQLYYLLVTNISEPGMFVTMLGLLVVGAMLLLRLSAAEIAIFFISIGRSFIDARRRRVQKRQAAARLAAQQAAAAQPVSVSKPAVAELEAGAQPPALPAAQQSSVEAEPLEEPRPIPITMGGKTVTAFFGQGEPVPVEANAEQGAQTASAAPAQTGGDEKKSLGARLGRALPSVSLPGLPGKSNGDKADDSAPEEKDDAPAANGKNGGRPGGRLFGSRQSAPPDRPREPAPAEDKPAEQKPPKPAEQPAASAAQPPAEQPPAMPEPIPIPDPTRKAEEPAARLGDLMGPATKPEDQPAETEKPAQPRGIQRPPAQRPQVRPFNRPADAQTPARPDTPAASDDEADDDDEQIARIPPAQPRSSVSTSRQQNLWGRPGTERPAAGQPPKPADQQPAQPEDKPPATDERRNRLEELRRERAAREEAAKAAPPAAEQPAQAAEQPTKPDEKPAAQSTPTDERRSRLDELRRGVAARQSAPESPAAEQPPKPAEQPATAEEKPAAPPAAAPAQPDEKPTQQPAQQPPAAEKPADARPTPVIREKPPVTATPPAAAQPAMRKPDGPPGGGPTSARPRKVYKLPEYRSLLNMGSETDFDREVLLQRARIIEDTLSSFGAPGRVVEVNTGPVITQYGVEPDYLTARSGKKSRVKVGAIAQLDKDLQLALGAKSIRIEAPVPGKGYVGIEVPNDESSIVSLRDVMESDTFRKIREKSPLAIALGQSVDGSPVAADLSSMPHLLVAGTTGSGKSVLVNAIITCLALNNTPDLVKFIMVDPKRVELTGYNGIPHLVAPVVVELERIVGVLKWVTREMDERYKQFSNAGARNIEDYNRHRDPNTDPMPYIVVIIDELADLMMLAPDETERVITRIAALARATGIHLVIATQRPSVDVVTGLIKANFPARIAFAVAGGVDSRVILDQPGAERLLGKGDMLYLSGDSPAPLRLQGVFVSDPEINNITRYWKTQMPDDGPSRPITALVVDDDIKEEARSVAPRSGQIAQQAFWDQAESASSDGDGDGGDQEDELYGEAVEMVRNLKKASVSLLQRRLRIGYTRAARLIDMMEERGIVGPAQEGSKPREVLKYND